MHVITAIQCNAMPIQCDKWGRALEVIIPAFPAITQGGESELVLMISVLLQQCTRSKPMRPSWRPGSCEWCLDQYEWRQQGGESGWLQLATRPASPEGSAGVPASLSASSSLSWHHHLSHWCRCAPILVHTLCLNWLSIMVGSLQSNQTGYHTYYDGRFNCIK